MAYQIFTNQPKYRKNLFKPACWFQKDIVDITEKMNTYKWMFPKMVVPPKYPKWSFLVGKPMVVGYHQFRKPPNRLLNSIIQIISKYPAMAGKLCVSIYVHGHKYSKVHVEIIKTSWSIPPKRRKSRKSYSPASTTRILQGEPKGVANAALEARITIKIKVFLDDFQATTEI